MGVRTFSSLQKRSVTACLQVCLFIILIAVIGKTLHSIQFFSTQRALLDFDAYYALSHEIRQGKNPYQSTQMQTLAAPPVFFLYLPFSFFPLAVAQVMITILNITSGILLCYFLAKEVIHGAPIEYGLGLAILLFIAFPTRFSVAMGQPALPIALAAYVWSTGSSWVTEIVTFTVLWFVKTHYLLLGVFALTNKRKLLILGGVTVCLLTFSLLFLGWSSYESFIVQTCIPLFSSRAVISGLDYYNQSLPSTLHRLFVPFSRSAFYLLALGVMILTIGVRNKYVLLLIPLLISPVVWQHYLVVLFPMFVIAIHHGAVKNDTRSLLLAGSAIGLWYLHLPNLQTTHHTFFSGLIGSHYYFSVACMFLFFLKNRTLNPSYERSTMV